MTKGTEGPHFDGTAEFIIYHPELVEQSTKLITIVAYVSNGIVHTESHNKCVWVDNRHRFSYQPIDRNFPAYKSRAGFNPAVQFVRGKGRRGGTRSGRGRRERGERS